MTSSTIGERFSPTHEELVNYYLKQKLLGNDKLVSRIRQLDIYEFDPWELPWTGSNDRKIYSFSSLHLKNSYTYTNDVKINRSTKTGSWKATGKDYKITSEHNGEEIGIRKIFVHSCIKDGIKYVMHEYSGCFNLPNPSSLVLCIVMKKSDKKSEGACKKVKKTEEKADVLPYNKDISTPASDDGSDFEKWISSEKSSDLSTYNNINNKDHQTEDSTCDIGGTSLVPDFTIFEEVEHEILTHLQPFPGYDQQDYSFDHFTVDEQPLTFTEQVHINNGPAGTSTSGQEEDLFIELEPLWA